jgi:poly-gamma-glutamate capsule biosynthesis protein CapA/YwtB (metallophosphatase superfamily)
LKRIGRSGTSAGRLKLREGAQAEPDPDIRDPEGWCVSTFAREMADVRPVTLFVCGDVMTGRGIDQILAHPSSPGIQEPYVRDARDYVELAEQANGPVPRPVAPAYIWGDALAELQRRLPDARIINLETSITRSEEFWPGKGIHYRMHPQNAACLTAAAIDVCVLANNHVLDYGYAGLEDTLDALTAIAIKQTGAGRRLAEARQPAIVDLAESRRIVVFSVGVESSGIPASWAADDTSPGVDLLPDLSEATADTLLDRVRHMKRDGDIVVVSIHWGSNWGYEISPSQIRFAHRLLDRDVDLLHGHSSHHPRPMEVYRGKLVLYGCGDFISDYEGIRGYEYYRDDLVLMYFPALDPATGRLLTLRMTPLRMRRMQLVHASSAESAWVRDRLALASREFGSDFELTDEGVIILQHRVASRA